MRTIILIPLLLLTHLAFSQDYCQNASHIIDGAQYYNNNTLCLKNKYSHTENLLANIKTIQKNKEAISAFCNSLNEPEQKTECLNQTSPFSLSNELAGFLNIIQSPAKPRTTLCEMAASTTGNLIWVINAYQSEHCSPLKNHT